MKLIYRGIYRGEDQLPKGELPDRAVPFQEPEDPEALNRAAMLFLLPALVVALGVVFGAVLLREDLTIRPFPWLLLGFLTAFLAIVPHELLHGLCFGQGAEVELFISPKDGMAFVVCTRPVSKGRFVWMCLCPNLVLGWLPLALWAVMPCQPGVGDVLLGFALSSLSMGCGDYLNVYNALRQMPRGSVQQLSGFHSYWYLP